MRSQKALLVLGLLFVVSLAVYFSGCGDDETPTNTTGSLNDPEFQAVQDQVDFFVDSTLEFFLDGFNSMTAVATGGGEIDPVLYGPVFPDSDYVSASYANGWHVLVLTKSRASYSFGVRDSVRFFNDGDAQQTAEDIDSLYFKHQWTFERADTAVTHSDLNGKTDLAISGLDGAQATINGSHQMTINHKQVTDDSTVWRDFEFEAAYTDIVVSKTFSGWEQSCPESGNVTATVEMTYQKDDGTPVISTWTIEISFSAGTASVTATIGNIHWNYSGEVCQTPGA